MQISASHLYFLLHFPENEASSLKKNKTQTNGFCGAGIGWDRLLDTSGYRGR